MQLADFRNKLALLHKKSGMDECIDWPFVYDRDGDGIVYISEDGIFNLVDSCHNWMPVGLTVGEVCSMKYRIAFHDPVIDSKDGTDPFGGNITIYFFDGSSIDLTNWLGTHDVVLRFNLSSIDCADDRRFFQEFDLLERGSRVYVAGSPLCPRDEEPWSSLAGDADMVRRLEHGDAWPNEAARVEANEEEVLREGCGEERDADPAVEILLKMCADIALLDDLVRVREADCACGGDEADEADGIVQTLVARAKECALVSSLNVAEAIYNAWRLYEVFADGNDRDRSDFTETLVACAAMKWMEDNGLA